ncbi:MAG: helix-turn-helix transcriptional regulator [Clostridium lundense]|nr:helix-turn-helix transcriptional regulator [Clostridium lundense]
MYTIYSIAIPKTYYYSLTLDEIYTLSKKDTLGERIKKLRKQKGYTAKELSTTIGVTTSGVLGYENNKAYPSRNVIKNLYEIFGDDLLCDEYSRFIIKDYISIIESWRRSNNLTKKEAARQLDMTETFYHQLLKEKRTLTHSYFNKIKNKLKEIQLTT